MLPSWKIEKNVQFNYLFLENSYIFYLCPRKTFLSGDWKKLSVWNSILFTVFALEMRKRAAYRKQTGSKVSVFLNKVSVLSHDRLMQVSHIVSWIFENT